MILSSLSLSLYFILLITLTLLFTLPLPFFLSSLWVRLLLNQCLVLILETWVSPPHQRNTRTYRHTVNLIIRTIVCCVCLFYVCCFVTCTFLYFLFLTLSSFFTFPSLFFCHSFSIVSYPSLFSCYFFSTFVFFYSFLPLVSPLFCFLISISFSLSFIS